VAVALWWGLSVIFFGRRVHGDGRGAPTVGLGGAGSMRKLNVLFTLRQGLDNFEQGLRGGDQFGIGGGVDRFELLGQRLLPTVGFGLGFHLVDGLATSLSWLIFFDKRFQAFVRVGDGRLGSILRSSQAPADRAATMAFVTISGVMATAAIVP
jgi:hypothetical protein